MGTKTIKICDYCETELGAESHSIRLNGVSNFGDWKNLEFCHILCFMSYMDGNIRAYKEALEKEAATEVTIGTNENPILAILRQSQSKNHNTKEFLADEIALYDPYAKKFECNPFTKVEEKPCVRKIDMDE